LQQVGLFGSFSQVQFVSKQIYPQGEFPRRNWNMNGKTELYTLYFLQSQWPAVIQLLNKR